jgi:HAD superfamily hydrolase (TIGR01450 family)
MISLPNRIKGVLFDLDGVLYIGNEPIPGARKALTHLSELAVPCRFITNTSTKTATDVASKLADLGFPIENTQIFSAVTATRDFLRARGNPSVNLLIRDAAKAEFSEFNSDAAQPDFVVVGDIGAAWDYALLNEVFNQLMSGAGLYGVLVRTGKYRRDIVDTSRVVPDVTIDSIADLLSL